MKNKTVKLASWTPILVSAASLIGITLLLGLMDFKWERILTLSYWVESAITTMVGSFVYTYSYFTFIRKERDIEGTAYKEVALLHYKYQKAIRENQLRDSLIPEVDKENERRRIDAISKMLAIFGMVYSDLEEYKVAEDPFQLIEEAVVKKRFNKKKTKKFRKVMDLCLFGEVKYEKINIDDLLNDMDADKDSANSNTMVEDSDYHKKAFIVKLITTTVVSVLLTVLAFKSIFDKRWLEIVIRNASVITTNCITASLKAKSYINYRKMVLTNRNNFFARCINKQLLGA